MIKSIGMVMSSKLIIQVIGFLITIITAREFGMGDQIGTYFYVYGFVLIPVAIFNLSARSLVITELNFILLSKLDAFSDFIKYLIKFSIIVACFSIVVLILLVELNLHFNFLGMDGGVIRKFSYLLLPVVFLLTLSEIFTGVFNSKRKFGWPEFAEIIKVLVTLASLFLFSESLGVLSLILGSIVGGFISTLLLFTIIKKNYLTKDSCLDLSEDIKDFKGKIYSLMATNILIALQPFIVISYIALSNGYAVSVYSYAIKIVSIPAFVLSSVIFVVFSHWSNFATKQQNEKITNSALNVLLVGFLLIGIFLILIIFKSDLLILAFFGSENLADYDNFIHVVIMLTISSMFQYAISTLTRIIQAHRMVREVNIYRVVYFLISIFFVYIFHTTLKRGFNGVIESLLVINVVMLGYAAILLYVKRIINMNFIYNLIAMVAFTAILILTISYLIPFIVEFIDFSNDSALKDIFILITSICLYFLISATVWKKRFYFIFKKNRDLNL
jgi:O-antigen/teichoic acid export membrane protein